MYFIHISVYMSIPISEFIPYPRFPPFVSICLFSTSVSISALQTGSSVPFFQIPHICIDIRYLFFSFLLTSLCMTVSRSIHVSTNDPISFLFMAELYSIVSMYHIFFIHSSVDGHLGCFYDLAIANSAAMNIGVHLSFELWFSLGICPVVGLLGHMVIIFLVFKGTSILFSIVAVSIYIPTNSARGFPFLHTFTNTCISSF